MATHVFLRHFEKRAHLFLLPPRLVRTLPAPAARALVWLWRAYDRRLVGLSSEGRRAGLAQAFRLRNALSRRGITPSRVIASPFRRARASAMLVAGVLDLPVSVDGRLGECDLGARSACDFGAFCSAFPEYLERVEREGYLYVPAPYACESHSSAREGRVRTFLADLAREEGSAVVVAHYNVLDCVAQLAYGWSDEEMVERMAALAGARYGEGFFLACHGTAICASGEFPARELR